MTDSEHMLLKTFIMNRYELVFSRLKDNTRYKGVCRKQEDSEKLVNELLHTFDKEDYLTITRHYELEAEKTGIALEELYMQGLRDGIKILTLLGVFNTEVRL